MTSRSDGHTRPTAGARSFSGTVHLLATVGVGNAMEWFDWALYATLAPFFAVQIFHSGDQISNLMSAFALYAVGFAARPFGGLLFGWIADRRGRKQSLTLSLALIALGSIVIGLCPTYAMAGAAAPIILVSARLLQGLSYGGEIPSAQTYLVEMAPAERRGVWGSLTAFSGTVGQLAGIVLAAVLSTVLSSHFMADWGWRMPFVLGGAFGLYGLYLRSGIRETEAFTEAADDEHDTRERDVAGALWREVRRRPLLMLQVIGMTGGFTLLYYVWSAAAPSYAITVKGVPAAHALWAGVAALGVFMISLPAWGALSDRIGRKPVLIGGVLLTAAASSPLRAALDDSALRLFLSMAIVLACAGSFSALLPTVNAEMFPTGIRAIGVAIPYSFAIALFGGTAPFLQTYLAHSGRNGLFTWYVMVMALVSAAVVLTIPETNGRELLDSEPAPGAFEPVGRRTARVKHPAPSLASDRTEA